MHFARIETVDLKSCEIRPMNEEVEEFNDTFWLEYSRVRMLLSDTHLLRYYQTIPGSSNPTSRHDCTNAIRVDLPHRQGRSTTYLAQIDALAASDLTPVSQAVVVGREE